MKQLFFILFFSLTISLFSSAQLTFNRVDTVQVIDDSLPLKNAWAGGLNYPMVEEMDLNGDGIMDLVLYEQGDLPGHDRIIPFMNHGDSGVVDYQYAPQYISLFPVLNQWLVTYDYNCDGRMDLLTLVDTCGCGPTLYRNDYTPSGGLKFTKVIKLVLSYYGSQQLNMIANQVSYPVPSDVDNDGALDFIGWPVSPNGCLTYYRGLRVDSGWSSCDSVRFNMATDSWGSFNLEQGSNFATLGKVCDPERHDSAVHWDAGIALQDDTQSCICIYEQDSTLYRKKDALIGGYNDNNMIYLHNGGQTTSQDTMDYEDPTWPSYNVPINLPTFPCAYNLDVDNDGKKDMIISPHAENDYRGMLYYKNTDLASDTPIFTRQPHTFLQEEMIDVGTASAPQLFDYDCDGLPDLLIGDYGYYMHTSSTADTGVQQQGIALYKNVGTSSAPRFKLMNRDFAGLNELNGLTGTFILTFGDLNNDGYKDMITGSGDGNIYYFQNTGCPANFPSPPTGAYFNIHVGQSSAPQLYDLNNDGLLDLVIGNAQGILKYYQNTGTLASPQFNSTPTKDTLGGIIVQPPFYTSGYASPFLYKDNGITKLILGTEYGEAYVYDNIDGNISGNYHLTDSLINGEDGANITLTIGDINNDGHPDMIVGNNDGGLFLYMNKDTTTGIALYKTVLPSFDAYPNPASDELHLDFYHIESMQAYFEIVNSIGQRVYETAATADKMDVSLKNLSNGIYLARFVSAENAQSLKIVVRH